MSETLNIAYLTTLQVYNHRRVVGPPMTEFEVLAYEQMCRVVQSMAEYTRTCIDKAIVDATKETT